MGVGLVSDAFADPYAAGRSVLLGWLYAMIGSKGDGRTVRRALLSLVCAAAAIAGAAPALQAETLKAHYSVSLMGLEIGDLFADGTVQPQSYRMTLHAHLSGLATMVSNTQMALASTGTVSKKNTIAPSTYATSAVGSNETRTLRMALVNGTVKAQEIVPQPEFRGERVPLTEANKRNILDPTSALIMPVPMKQPLVGPGACERTLPVYDGYARFDIALHYQGTRDVQIAGYSGPVAVCSARYHPIAGHMVNSRSTAFMAQNTGIEVWLAPLPQAHVVVPLRVSMPTMAGALDISAVEFAAGSAAEGTH